jgi:hypothetical protein
VPPRFCTTSLALSASFFQSTMVYSLESSRSNRAVR